MLWPNQAVHRRKVVVQKAVRDDQNGHRWNTTRRKQHGDTRSARSGPEKDSKKFAAIRFHESVVMYCCASSEKAEWEWSTPPTIKS